VPAKPIKPTDAGAEYFSRDAGFALQELLKEIGRNRRMANGFPQ